MKEKNTDFIMVLAFIIYYFFFLKKAPKFSVTHRGNQIWKRHVHTNVHRSTVSHSQDMEAT